MSTQIGVGISHHRNPATAGEEAVSQALRQSVITGTPDFVMLFATVGYRQEVLLKSVRAATQQAPLIGCSVAGTIVMGEADESNFAVTVLLIKSDEMTFARGMTTGIKDSSLRVGESVGEAVAASSATQKNAGDEPKALFLFLEGISSNFDAFMEGVRSRTDVEQSIPAIGGLAGDNVAIRETFQYCDDRVVSDGAVWALLAGEVQIASVMSHGCVPLGESHTVTKSDRNRVYEVDNLPVLKVLKSYLSQAEIDNWGIAAVMVAWALELPDHLLNVDSGARNDSACNDTIIRCMATRDEAAGAIHLLADAPVGSRFWIVRRDQAQICEQAIKMADALIEKMGQEQPKLLFQVECAGRGKLIFREQEKLSLNNSLQARIGSQIPWIGLYAFAEIGPTVQQNSLHNFTGILTALY